MIILEQSKKMVEMDVLDLRYTKLHNFEQHDEFF